MFDLFSNLHVVLLFPTIEFLIFFVATFTFWLCFKNKYRLACICVFNLIFYGFYSRSMLIYLLIWSLLLWICGYKLKYRYLLISLSIFSLVFWKAIDAKFINFNSITTPLGVSFFTFQGLTYLFSRMKLPAHKIEEHINEPWSFLKIFAFTGFFPTVFSGPILRAKQWSLTLENPVVLTQKTLSYSLSLIAIGAFYKLCLSSIFHDYVSLAYSNPKDENALNLLIGMYAYTFEIYHDFAGYSLMAIGISLLYGFSIPDNFKQPYLSLNIRDFWQRWHISFSFWLRDYFYIALGGSKFGLLKHLRNTFIVMFVCGAWHGLSSNYLIWGAIHGISIIGFHIIKDKFSFPKWLSWFITFHYIAFTWIFFRSPNANIAVDYIIGLFNFEDYKISTFKPIAIFILFIFCLLCQWLEKYFFNKEFKFNHIIFSPIMATIFWSIIFILILILSPSGMPPFIYFSY